MVHPEVKSALQMMSFLKYNRRKKFFHRRLTAFFIVLMKLSAAVYIEILQLTMMSQQDNIEDIIKDFVVLGFIIELDNFIAANIDTSRIEAKIKELDGKLLIDECD